MKRKEKQKKRGKTGLVLLCMIILCAVAIAVFFLIGEYSQGKKEYEAQIKTQTQELTDKLISEIENVDTTDKGLAGQEAANSDSEEVPDGIITNAEKELVAEELAKQEDERKQKVLQTLTVAYSKALNEQKQAAFQMVEDLIVQGKADWAAMVADGEGTAVNKAKLASEYLAKSDVMESEMDASFEALAATMEEQLKAEGIDPASIIDGYRAEYDKIKEENRQSLMNKVLDQIKN